MDFDDPGRFEALTSHLAHLNGHEQAKILAALTTLSSGSVVAAMVESLAFRAEISRMALAACENPTLPPPGDQGEAVKSERDDPPKGSDRPVPPAPPGV